MPDRIFKKTKSSDTTKGKDKDKDKPKREKRRREEEPEPIAEEPAAKQPAKRTIEDDILAKFGPNAVLPKPKEKEKDASQDAAKSSSIPIVAPVQVKPRAAAASGPMIVVKINDRLGTATKVPCLPSDTVGDFKKMVAMRIGRKPHEIMIKRQSERPFKDFLTLADYNVSDGVQLDLELDTGD